LGHGRKRQPGGRRKRAAAPPRCPAALVCSARMPVRGGHALPQPESAARPIRMGRCTAETHTLERTPRAATARGADATRAPAKPEWRLLTDGACIIAAIGTDGELLRPASARVRHATTFPCAHGRRI
jgi:hypothetical protein